MASGIQAAPLYLQIKSATHPSNTNIIHQKQLIANITASTWFQKPQNDKRCPYTWKVTAPVHDRFPRQIIEAECKKCNKLLCKPLYYHIFVRYTHKVNGKHSTWQSIRIPVAFIYKLWGRLIFYIVTRSEIGNHACSQYMYTLDIAVQIWH